MCEHFTPSKTSIISILKDAYKKTAPPKNQPTNPRNEAQHSLVSLWDMAIAYLHQFLTKVTGDSLTTCNIDLVVLHHG